MNRRMRMLVVTVALGGSAIVGGAQPTSATLSQCTGTRTCLWGNNGFDWLLSSQSQNLGLVTLSSGTTDRMDSWANLSSSYNSQGRDAANGTGDCQTFAMVSNDDNVNPWNSDEVSSYRTNGGC